MEHQEPVNIDQSYGFDRILTRWRMNYVCGDPKSTSCVFCELRNSADDLGNLVFQRGPSTHVVMNLFPYNTGHMLIVPNLRVASPEELPDNMLHDLADQVPLALSAARRALAPHAFNIGFNLGEDAGAGIAAHLHQHVVPRWRGDANFLPVVSGTKVLPELLPVNAARIREELMRSSTATFRARVLDRTCDRMLVDPDGQPPIILTDDDKPVWNTAVDAAACFRTTARLTGLHRRDGDITLTLDGDEIDKPQLGAIWIPAEKFQSLS